MRSIGTPTTSCQIFSASSSLSWTVIQMRSPSKPHSSVTSSQLYGIASSLKYSPKLKLPIISKNTRWRLVRPTSSRSLCLPPARTHFCELTAVGKGGASSPTK